MQWIFYNNEEPSKYTQISITNMFEAHNCVPNAGGHVCEKPASLNKAREVVLDSWKAFTSHFGSWFNWTTVKKYSTYRDLWRLSKRDELGKIKIKTWGSAIIILDRAAYANPMDLLLSGSQRIMLPNTIATIFNNNIIWLIDLSGNRSAKKKFWILALECQSFQIEHRC